MIKIVLPQIVVLEGWHGTHQCV